MRCKVFALAAALAACVLGMDGGGQRAGAQHCAVSFRSYAPAYAPVTYQAYSAYVAPAATTYTYTPSYAVPAFVPVYTYSATYGGPSDPGVQEMSKLRQELKVLQAYIQGMAAGGQRQQAPVPQQLPRAARPDPEAAPAPERAQRPTSAPAGGYLRHDCAKCHTKGTEKGKFAMFDDKAQFILTPEQLGDCLVAVNGTFDDKNQYVPPTMPKGGKDGDGNPVTPLRRGMYNAEFTKIGGQMAAAAQKK